MEDVDLVWRLFFCLFLCGFFCFGFFFCVGIGIKEAGNEVKGGKKKRPTGSTESHPIRL